MKKLLFMLCFLISLNVFAGEWQPFYIDNNSTDIVLVSGINNDPISYPGMSEISQSTFLHHSGPYGSGGAFYSMQLHCMDNKTGIVDTGTVSWIVANWENGFVDTLGGYGECNLNGKKYKIVINSRGYNTHVILSQN